MICVLLGVCAVQKQVYAASKLLHVHTGEEQQQHLHCVSSLFLVALGGTLNKQWWVSGLFIKHLKFSVSTITPTHSTRTEDDNILAGGCLKFLMNANDSKVEGLTRFLAFSDFHAVILFVGNKSYPPGGISNHCQFLSRKLPKYFDLNNSKRKLLCAKDRFWLRRLLLPRQNKKPDKAALCDLTICLLIYQMKKKCFTWKMFFFKKGTEGRWVAY